MDRNKSKPGGRARTYAICVVLVGLVLIAYWQVFDFGFVRLDDPTMISANPRVMGGLSAANIRWAFTTTHAEFRMPLVWLSLMLDRDIGQYLAANDIELGPDNAGVFHVTNVLLHLASTLFLFAALSRMTNRPWPSAFVAALFAIHPLHVESVAWASERKDVLSGLFWMLGLLVYANYARKPSGKRYALLVGVFVLGLMAKPIVAVLALVYLLLDYWPLGRLQVTGYGGQGSGVRGLVACCKSLTTTESEVPNPQSQIPNLKSPSSGPRPPAALVLEKLPFFALGLAAGIVTYFAQESGKTLGTFGQYPLGVRLANGVVSYLAYLRQTFWPTGLVVFYPHPETGLPWSWVAASGIALAAITLVAVRAARSRPYVLVGWLWYVVTLLPVGGIVQVGAFARADRFTYIPLVGIFIIVAWGFADVLPLAWRACARLLPLAWRERVGVRGNALAACAAILALLPLTYAQIGCWRDDFALFGHAVRVSDRNWVGHHGLGQALEDTGDLEGAIAHFSKAAKLASSYKLEFDLARALVGKGDARAAMAHFSEAIRIDPDIGEAHLGLACALASIGRPREAVRSYRMAAQRMQIKPAVTIMIARLLSVHPEARYRDGRDAVSLALEACRATGYSDPMALDTLAAAYAEAGMFTKAIATAERAMEAAATTGSTDLADQMSNRIRLYRQHRPYRESVR